MTTTNMEGIVDFCIEDGIEDEKCVVAQYRTTSEQKETMKKHLQSCQKIHIPVEWVIDIADESNGWFYGTAYHYDDISHMLHVMVPDKQNPSFDGRVVLDHRTVHLIECVDEKTDALFNKLIRDSIMKVKWEVECFDEDKEDDNSLPVPPTEATVSKGRWITSTAKYYIRMANQLLVEDESFGQSAKGFVMLTADFNVRLLSCTKGHGIDDFNRLIIENVTLSSAQAAEAAKLNGSAKSSDLSSSAASYKRVADMARSLRESTADLLGQREIDLEERLEQAKLFQAFSLDGDLDAGVKLLDSMDLLISRSLCREAGGAEEELSSEDVYADEAWYLSQKLEKNIANLVRSMDSGATCNDEVESLLKIQKKLKRELEEKDLELERLRDKFIVSKGTAKL